MSERRIGIVEHYYPRAGAAVVRLEDSSLRTGQTVHFVGHGTDLQETVERIERDHQPVERARRGQSVGVEVVAPVHEKAEVFLVE